MRVACTVERQAYQRFSTDLPSLNNRSFSVSWVGDYMSTALDGGVSIASVLAVDPNNFPLEVLPSVKVEHEGLVVADIRDTQCQDLDLIQMNNKTYLDCRRSF